MMFRKGFLQRVQCLILGETFNGSDIATVRLQREQRTRFHAAAVEQNGASAAVAGVTPDVCSGKSSLLAHKLDEELSWFRSSPHEAIVHADTNLDERNLSAHSSYGSRWGRRVPAHAPWRWRLRGVRGPPREIAYIQPNRARPRGARWRSPQASRPTGSSRLSGGRRAGTARPPPPASRRSCPGCAPAGLRSLRCTRRPWESLASPGRRRYQRGSPEPQRAAERRLALSSSHP